MEQKETRKALTEEEVYDFYQERSGTAGDRADQLAWMFVAMAAGVLISGHAWQTFFVSAALSVTYLLLSVLQAVWQAFTAWLFKRQVSRMATPPTDYPWWIGCGAWLLFWLKMAAITAAVVCFVKSVFF